MDLDKIIKKQQDDYKNVNDFYSKYKIQYYDMAITSYTRNNINIEIYRKDLRNYFIKNDAAIYLPFIYKYFKIKISI